MTYIKYRGVKIIIENTKHDFNCYAFKSDNYLIIIYGAKCINKSKVLHRAIHIIKN